jgi:nuclear pore complex protein Nup62
MDEILGRWASDLSKYQLDFKEQAEKVAQWDRLMVDNGDKIQKLYHSTWQAEHDSAEIERQLANVESQQDELAAWLDRYEGEVDEMFARQIGQGETQGPDQERERTYKLAEKLTERLDEMGKNLTSMIDAVNDASTTLSKTSKSDDPVSTQWQFPKYNMLTCFQLSHIVRVLNSHLTQLQWIDENAMALQTKVAEAQKSGQSIGSNGHGGPENDLAESFYRSMMGRK